MSYGSFLFKNNWDNVVCFKNGRRCCAPLLLDDAGRLLGHTMQGNKWCLPLRDFDVELSNMMQLNFANFPESLNKWFRWIFSEYVRCSTPSFVWYLIMRNPLLRVTILISIHCRYINVNLITQRYYSLLYKVCINELLLSFIITSSKPPHCRSVCHNACQVFSFFDCLRARLLRLHLSKTYEAVF